MEGVDILIVFTTRRLQRTFNSDRALTRRYGSRMARILKIRLALLKNASSLSQVPRTPPDRCHMLIGDRHGQFVVDLVHPYRLVFEPTDPVPLKEDGGVDLDGGKGHYRHRHSRLSLIGANPWPPTPTHTNQITLSRPVGCWRSALDAHDISQAEFARRCGRSPKLISEIIAGKAPIEPGYRAPVREGAGSGCGDMARH